MGAAEALRKGPNRRGRGLKARRERAACWLRVKTTGRTGFPGMPKKPGGERRVQVWAFARLKNRDGLRRCFAFWNCRRKWIRVGALRCLLMGCLGFACRRGWTSGWGEVVE